MRLGKCLFRLFLMAIVALTFTYCGNSFEESRLASIQEEAPADIEIANYKGEQTTLGAYHQKKFLLVDFSRAGCGGCMDSAERMNVDAVFQEVIEKGLCKMITITPTSGLPSWIEIVGENSFVAKHSFNPLAMEYDQVAEALKFNMQSVPTFLLIDRSWSIVTGDGLTSASGDIESYDNAELKKICKGE